MNRDRAKIVLEEALKRLLADDLRPELPAGFPRTIGERPLVFRLAHYLVECGAEEGELRLDCDYNRHGTSVKELLPTKEEVDMPVDDKGAKPKRFFPDIVLHRRGDDGQNVLVCEIKRSGDQRDPNIDRGRLVQLTRRDGIFHYDLGAFVLIDQNNARISIEYFEDGKASGSASLPPR